MKHTITHSERAKGWTSFHSFFPEWMGRLNSNFFSVKSGQLYRHHDSGNVVRNNYYGQQYGSKVKTVFNTAPSDDKVFKTLVIEGSRPWHAKLSTNMASGTISQSEFNTRESRHFAYIRKNEDDSDYTGHSAQGIGVVLWATGNEVNFGFMSDMIAVGDKLYQINGESNELIGEISGISGNTVTVASVVTPAVAGLYCFGKKDSRIEGGEMRGYSMEVELSNEDTEAVKLFAVSTNAIKSYL